MPLWMSEIPSMPKKMHKLSLLRLPSENPGEQISCLKLKKPQAFKSLEIMAIEIVSNETEVKTAIVKYDSLIEFEFAN